MSDRKIAFTPVYGTKDKILNAEHVSGHIYFSTDSGEIYLDTATDRVKVGSSNAGAALFYSEQFTSDEVPIPTIEYGDDDVDYYLLSASDIDTGDASIRVNDLIIATDGAFYRFVDTDDTGDYICLRMAISGNGGGGGGTVVEPDLTLQINSSTLKRYQTLVEGQHHIVLITAHSDTDIDVDLSFNFTGANGYSYAFTRGAVSDVPYELDLSFLPANSNIKMVVSAHADNSTMTKDPEKSVSDIKVVTMGIEKPYADAYIPLVEASDMSGTLTLQYKPIGDPSIALTLHCYVDNDEIPSLRQTIPSSNYGRVASVAVPRQTHGVHQITLNVSTLLGETEIVSNSITYEGAWASNDDNTPIIWIGKHDETIINYENSYIYYMVYDPVAQATGVPANIYLYRGSVEIAQVEAEYNADNWLVWDISNVYEVGENILSIACRTSKVDISAFVTTEGSRDLGLVAQDTLLVNMTTAGRSSTEIKSQREVFKSTVNENNINAILKDFNWQNNGWRNSDGIDSSGVDSGSYLSIANGAALDIQLSGGLTLNQAKNYSFEFRFRVKNVQEYSTLIRTIPKYFYMVPDETVEGGWRPTYTITSTDEDDIVTGPSLYESEIIAAGYKIGVDKYGNLLMDEANTVKREDTSSGVVVRWLNDSGYGFCIGTQEAYFRTPSGIANVRYCEDEIINLTMVASKTDNLCYIYLNGILSGAIAMPTGTGSSFSINAPFKFNSEYCDLDLYRFRVYELGLTMPQVIHNYLSDMHSIALYDQNQITDPLDPTALSYELLVAYNEEHPESVTMPYATWQITDGSDELLPWKKGNKRKARVEFVNPPLDRAFLSGEIDAWTYYTHSPSFSADNVDINVQGTSSQKYPRRNYKLQYKKATNWVYTLGPLAGLSIAEDHVVNDSNGTPHTLVAKFHMDAESYGVNNFTWKIDYMESSESYNTGFANLMGNLVHPLYTKHPLDDLHLSGVDTSDMRTTVYGFPVLTFHKYANNDYEYIGKYNMNLDKSANEAYGFESKAKQPYVNKRIRKVLNTDTNQYVDEVYQPTVKEISECWELKDNQGTWCSFKFPDANARRDGFMTLKEGTSGDSAQLEILNHYEYRYSFYKDELDAAYEYTGFTDANTQVEYTNNGQINGYLYEKHANFEQLFRWLDSTDQNAATNTTFATPVVYTTASYVTNDPSVDYEILLTNPTVLTAGTEYQEFYLDNKGNKIKNYYFVAKNSNYWFYDYDESTWADDVAAGRVYTAPLSGLYKATFTKDTKEYRRQKFRAELSRHLDKEYCLTYFVLTELLLCYDSRGKNCMMASFGPQSCTYTLADNVTEDNYQLYYLLQDNSYVAPSAYDENATYYQRVPGDYIWYPIFYDIDTQLGLNNSGAYLWDYDADVTKDNLFSTPTSVLWVNLYDVFYDDIVQKYRVLRSIQNPSGADALINGSLTVQNIVGAYEYDAQVFASYAMQGVRPIVAVGLDEYYKYLAPALTALDFASGKYYAGYYDTTGTHLYQNTPTYVYACQGDKKLTTELLVRNRLNYIDSWWLGGDYTAGVVENQIFIRANANHRSTSDRFLDSDSIAELTPALDADFDLAPYPKEYFDARPGAKIKPFLHQYVSYFMDSQPSVPVKYDGSQGQEDGVWTNVDAAKLIAFKTEPDLSQQITYIPGGDYISSLGDISLMYPNSLQIFHGQRMLDLRLGSDVPGYSNPLITSSSDWELATMPLLKFVNVSKLSNFNRELNLLGSAKLQEFRGLDSIIERVNFASGAPLHTVHLPSTMTTISLVQNAELKNILTTRPEVMSLDANTGNYIVADPEDYRGLYIEGVTDYTSNFAGTGHNIGTLEIRGGGLGYNSYIILRNLYNLKYGASTKQMLSIALADVNWTPYIQIEYGTPYNSSTTYYLFNDHSTFEPFTFESAEDWNNKLLNGLVYMYNPDYDGTEEETITDLSLLDNFISIYETAKASSAAESQFNNTSGGVTMPAIGGVLYVANDSEHKINEELLTSKYKVYFPNLTIQVKNVEIANLTKYVRSYTDHRIEVLDIERTNGTTPLLPTISAPTQTYYNFLGWSLDAPAENTTQELALEYDRYTQQYTPTSVWEALEFDANTTVITLYAVFTVQQFGVKFYNGDGSLIVEDPANPVYYETGQNTYEQVTKLVAYNTVLPEVTVTPYKDDSSLVFDRKYVFKGWEITQTGRTENIVNLKNKIVTTNLVYYPVFKEDDVHNDILSSTFLTGTLTTISGQQGVLIGLRPGCIVTGKITLPKSFKINDVTYPVLGVASDGFAVTTTNNNAQHITMVFWESGARPVLIGAGAFRVEANSFNRDLKYYEFTESITTIENNAFSRVGVSVESNKPTTGGLINRDLASAMPNWSSSFTAAFARAFGPVPGNSTLIIPGSLSAVAADLFRYNGPLGITTIQLGTAEMPSTLSGVGNYGGAAFRANNNTGDNPYEFIIYTENPNDEVWDVIRSDTGATSFTWPLQQG